MLWLALRFPCLPLDALALPPGTPSTPRAAARQGRVVAANGPARELGVWPGLGLASAWGLAPDLQVQEEDPLAQDRAMEGLACWGFNFTPQVCLDPPAGLLLEIGGCLRLFGGLSPLVNQALDGARRQGYTLAWGLAATPKGARWQANAGDWLEPLAADAPPDADLPMPPLAASLSAQLAPLPLDCLELPPKEQQRLTNFGVRCLGDLLALPRAGLNRRLGLQLAADLARALGEIPDSRPRYPYPETFRQGLELPARVEDAPALRFAARRLLQQLQGWLAGRGAGVSRCTLELHHEAYRRREQRPPTRLTLGFAGLTRDGARLERVLAERLGQLNLEAPVEALTLVAEETGELAGSDRTLQGLHSPDHNDSGPAPDQAAITLERLKARLGEDKVYSLAAVADHRPEMATRKCAPMLDLGRPGSQAASQSPPPPSQGPRPLWLLTAPQPLREERGRPRHGGPLELLAGPERIESGWWDEGESNDGRPTPGDLRRDYFVARNPAGEWLWVFRDESGWFLHGRFA